MEVRVTQLTVYPVKGCGPVHLDTMRLDAKGPVPDRRWLVVLPDGTFVTQREHPRLALVRQTLTEDALVLEAPGLRALRLPLTPRDGQSRRVQVWSSQCDGIDQGEEAAAFFGELLGAEVRFVALPPDQGRPVDHGDHEGLISFADGFPLLVCHQASLDDLNRRLSDPVEMGRFRPNVVVEGGQPWDEDRWGTLQGPEVDLLVAKPCERCKVITVDPATAETSKEPLKTLATFRRIAPGGGVVFGQNLIHRGPGLLRVGENLRVTSVP